MYTSHIWDYG